jgi:hypothetical protein
MTPMRPAPLRPARGHILSPPRGAKLGPASTSAAQPLAGQGLLLACALPMFAQCFQYMTDIPPLYMLSKVWPFLLLPAFVWAVASFRMPYKALHLANLFWLLAVTPAMGIIQLGNSFPDAMATTVKVWSFTYAFSAAGILVLLHPDAATLRRILLGLGAGTFVLMLGLWIIVPASAYGGGDLATKLFMTDVERGYRIYMPMFFGILLILYLNRSMMQRFAMWKFVAMGICFILMLTIYKQRAAIAGVLLAAAIGACLSLRRWRVAAFSALALFGTIAIAVLLIRMQGAAELKSGLGNSLAVREVTVGQAWAYISAEPLRWLLGVGGTTRLGEVTLGRLFNNPMFFLTDIGWLGVLFEYGAIGVILMLSVHFAGLRLAMKWSRPDDPLSQAFADYIVYLLATSFVYSVVFTPGELMTIMALSYYFARVRAGTPYGIGTAQPAMPRPRHRAPARSLALGPPPSGIASSG